MELFKELFESYGADYETTMSRFAGNEKFYLRVLGMLPNDKSMENLGRTIKNGDMAGAFEAAHTLKGVAGNLGLTPLFEAVFAIVEPLRKKTARDDYMQLYTVIQGEYERAGAFLESLKDV